MPENEPDDVLSQDEVNDLLSNLPGAEEVEDEQTEEAGENDNTGPRVRIYDFLRPDILSVEEVQMLTADGERIAEAANRSLSALGLADAALTVTSVDVLTLDEYIRSLSRPCYVVPFVYDGKRTVTVELAPTFAVHAAHAAMGLPVVGSPSLASLPDVLRRGLAAATTAAFGEALARSGPAPQAGRPLATPVELRALSLGTTVCVLTFSAESQTPSLLATVAIGRPALETLWRARTSRSASTSSAAETAAPVDLLLRRTLRFPVPGVTGSTLRAFLETGDLDVSNAEYGRVAYEEE